MLRYILTVLSFALTTTVCSQDAWPSVTNETKPWTRWWWLGSAVDTKGLDENLAALHKAGIGGVEITPIYGIKGQEHRFLNFLTKPWLDALTHTLKRASTLGMGVDLANATGWPFGGPWVSDADASKSVYHKTYSLSGGQSLSQPVVFEQQSWVRVANTTPRDVSVIKQPIGSNKNLQELALDQVQFPGKIRLEALMAYGPGTQTLDLTQMVGTDGRLNWTAPSGNWTLYAVFSGLHGKMVERAAPGGEGYAIDHFSKTAAVNYFKKFDTAFRNIDLKGLRGFFNDSYEVDDARGQANWTDQLFQEFSTRKGYDLRTQLPAFFGQADAEQNKRVLYDYRSVIDELILNNFTREWKKWGDKQGKVLRNQSHGSPANTLDLYSVVDIPETEGTELLRFKFASSASHVTGKRLTSAEACTWLNEHFLSSWGDVKKSLDQYFLGGVNHIVYHGNTYSPSDAAWPGWNFYAAVHFQPANPQWKQFDVLNQYVTRVQSFLQQGQPDHQVLMYYPIVDRYMQPGNALLQHFDGMEKNFEHTVFEELAKDWQSKGIGFDFISDRQLQQVNVSGTSLLTGGISYKTIVIPSVTYMDTASLYKLDQLARAGATVVFCRQLPGDVPGFNRLEERQASMKKLYSSWNFSPSGEARIGKGRILLGNDALALLRQAGVSPRPFESAGLQSFSRKKADSQFFFVVNSSDSVVDTMVAMPVSRFKTIRFFDPLTGKISLAKPNAGNIRIRLRPRESIIVTLDNQVSRTSTHVYDDSPDLSQVLNNEWSVRFVEGGPSLPASRTLTQLDMWTDFGDTAYTNFSGTAVYSTRFTLKDAEAYRWKIDLGTLSATAEVWINGKKAGELVGPDFQLDIPNGLLKATNNIEVYVSSLMANRIAYMDRNSIPWKIFYNINMSARVRDNLKNGVFDAGKWQPLPSGLKGPVTLLGY